MFLTLPVSAQAFHAIAHLLLGGSAVTNGLGASHSRGQVVAGFAREARLMPVFALRAAILSATILTLSK